MIWQLSKKAYLLSFFFCKDKIKFINVVASHSHVLTKIMN